MPWVRLHGIKDYYGMAWLAQQHPEVHLTFNFVPSLLSQIDDYAQGKADEKHLNLTAKPAADLAENEVHFILNEFFHANLDTMIRPHPRYHELLLKRRLGARTAAQVASSFSPQDILDLQVWATLAWFFPQLLRGDEVLRSLVAKGRGFTEADKRAMLDRQREVMAAIIPMYRGLQDSGSAELTISPLYHPILPLLCNMERAREALPNLTMPRATADLSADAHTQVTRAVEAYREFFGRAPRGMWPSEGSVSPEVPPLVAQAGIRWIATDETILCRSLGCTLHRDSHGLLQEWQTLYQPYRVPAGGSDLAIIFRDHYLSDLIGFHYYHRPAEDAADDLVQRLLAIGSQTGGKDAFVAIILDGENAWEYYQDSGIPFLHELYDRLASTPGIRTATVSESLAAHPPTIALPRLFSGSWINGDFAVWIGHSEDRRAWELLARAHQFLTARAVATPDIALTQAWEELYVAEGSDWFWWFGDDRSSLQDAEFDRLFRLHLKNVYRLAGERAPDALDEPIAQPLKAAATTPPTTFIAPTIDGHRGGYFEWAGAGLYQRDRDGGVMEKETPDLIREVRFGFSEREFFLRVDFTTDALPALSLSKGDARLVVIFTEPRELRIELNPLNGLNELNPLNPFKTLASLRVEGQPSRTGRAAIAEIIEIACPFEDLGLRPRETARFHVRLLEGGNLVDRAPRVGGIAFEIPSPDFEREMWQV